jgi:hypothetical protein
VEDRRNRQARSTRARGRGRDWRSASRQRHHRRRHRDDFPELPNDHRDYERRKSERKTIENQNASNVEQRSQITLRQWTTLFEALRSCCEKKAPLLAQDLFETCALAQFGIVGGYFDGPRAWRILLHRIEGEGGERTEHDKNFYTRRPSSGRRSTSSARASRPRSSSAGVSRLPSSSCPISPKSTTQLTRPSTSS